MTSIIIYNFFLQCPKELELKYCIRKLNLKIHHGINVRQITFMSDNTDLKYIS